MLGGDVWNKNWNDSIYLLRFNFGGIYRKMIKILKIYNDVELDGRSMKYLANRFIFFLLSLKNSK